MERLKNKNTIILIVSALLIVIALIVAVSAISGNSKKKKAEIEQSIAVSESVAQSLADLANQQTTEPSVTAKSFNFDVGTYKIATKTDPLGLRLEPNTSSDRIIYIPKGNKVKVLAVWEDWGYVVYEKTGGWLSMNYLEAVSTGTATTESTTQKTTSAQ